MTVIVNREGIYPWKIENVDKCEGTGQFNLKIHQVGDHEDSRTYIARDYPCIRGIVIE